MPAVPYREDDQAYGAPIRGGPAERGGPPSSDQARTVQPTPIRRAPAPREPRAPALEGLTASGAAVVGLIGATLGAGLDAALSPGFGWLYFTTFLVMSAFVGLRLRRRDAWAAFGVPPLVFIAAAGIAAQVGPTTSGGWVRRTSADMATAVLDHPYVLLSGTALAVVAFAYRALID
jgi:hypothetical protein